MNRSTFDAMLAQYKAEQISGEGIVSWDKGAHCVIPSVEIMGKCVQDGTPTPDAPIEPVFSEGTEVIVRGRNLANAYVNGGYYMTTEKIAENTFRLTCGSLTGGYGAIKIDHLPVGVPLRLLVTFCPEYPRSATYAIVLPRGNSGLRTIHISSAKEAGVSYSILGSAAVLSTGSIEIYLYNNMDNPGESAIWTISMYLDAQAVEYHTPYFDGGTAVAPELIAIPGTEYRDEWNPQTGKGFRRCAAIESYAGEVINTQFVSSTGELSEGAYVIYGIPDTPFETAPQPLIQPHGAGNIIQIGGTVDSCPIIARPVTHR